MITEKTIQEVTERANVFDVVSDFIELKKAGTVFKACCPFHNEKTPSFVVSPSKNIWHCFGCGKGGGAVAFVMEHEQLTYPEAIRWLAKKYNIQVIETDTKKDPEAEERLRKRESLFIITQKAAEYYARCLHADTPECKAALAYVNNRWNHRDPKAEKDDSEKDFPSLMGIGYAPGWDSWYREGLRQGWSVQLMEEAGLIKKSSRGTWIDTFHDRVTIPIRDRFRRVIGFTCRTMEEDRVGAKYINTSDTPIYHKGNNIFGIDMALKAAINEGRLYCVEGAPDAMQLQSIGIDNAVAGLGTAWTHEMFEQLKRYNFTLCFIPDDDVIKPGQRWGTGIEAVMKTGRMAVEEGFRVTVKEIPHSESEKQDADTYFDTPQKMMELGEEDFIIWLAKKKICQNDTATERGEKQAEICSIIATMKDPFTQDVLLEKLGNLWNGKNRWRSALSKAKKDNDRRRAEKINRQNGIDLMKKYGFIEDHNCYYGDNGTRRWSNFTMTPLFHIKDPFNAKRIFKVKNYEGRQELVELKTDELISLPKFKQRLESLGNFLWEGTQEDFNRLKIYLYENTESAEEIKQLGWNKADFFVWGNGIYYSHGFLPVDDYGIVRLERQTDGRTMQENYYLPAMSKIYADERELFKFERRFICQSDHSSITLPRFCEMLAGVFGDNAKIGVCFLLGTLFKDIITGYTKNFPILNLFGPKGSGKSELAHTLMGFFIKDDTGVNIQNATIAALADAIAQCSNALVHIDEYKNNIDPVKVEFLKGLYDGTGRSRMNMELDKKRQITAVDSAVVLSGQEMPTIDIALFSRTIYLTFPKATHTPEQKARFNELSLIRQQGVSHLTNEIISHRDAMAAGFYDEYNRTLKEMEKTSNGQTEDRLWRNWSMLLAVYRVMHQPLGLPWSDEEMKSLIADDMTRQNTECSSSNELGIFWDMFEYMISEGMIYKESDFKIKDLRTLDTNLVKREFRENHKVLMLRTKHVIPQYKKACRATDVKALPESSIMFYLQTVKGYMGKKNKVERFKVIIDGVQQRREVKPNQWRDIDTFDRPLCFDYELLSKTYNLNLETTDEEEEPEEVKTAEAATQRDLPF